MQRHHEPVHLHRAELRLAVTGSSLGHDRHERTAYGRDLLSLGLVVALARAVALIPNFASAFDGHGDKLLAVL